jgi:hypothetical protein
MTKRKTNDNDNPIALRDLKLAVVVYQDFVSQIDTHQSQPGRTLYVMLLLALLVAGGEPVNILCTNGLRPPRQPTIPRSDNLRYVAKIPGTLTTD